MGAPTHFGRFTLTTNLNTADHAGGQAYGYYGSTLTLDKTIDLAVKAAAQNGNVSFASDVANYGTGIVAGGTLQDFSSLPQFCSDADYLASNPTYVSYGAPGSPAVNGQYYCSDTGLLRYTNDSGATFRTYVPQIMSNGKIKLVTPGKYKVKIKHWCEITGMNSYTFASIHTVIIMGGVIKVNYLDRANWEFKNADAQNGLTHILDTEFDSIIEATSPNTEFSVGLSKLNVNSSNHTFVVTVESLF